MSALHKENNSSINWMKHISQIVLVNKAKHKMMDEAKETYYVRTRA